MTIATCTTPRPTQDDEDRLRVMNNLYVAEMNDDEAWAHFASLQVPDLLDEAWAHFVIDDTPPQMPVVVPEPSHPTDWLKHCIGFVHMETPVCFSPPPTISTKVVPLVAQPSLRVEPARTTKVVQPVVVTPQVEQSPQPEVAQQTTSPLVEQTPQATQTPLVEHSPPAEDVPPKSEVVDLTLDDDEDEEDEGEERAESSESEEEAQKDNAVESDGETEDDNDGPTEEDYALLYMPSVFSRTTTTTTTTTPRAPTVVASPTEKTFEKGDKIQLKTSVFSPDGHMATVTGVDGDTISVRIGEKRRIKTVCAEDIECKGWPNGDRHASKRRRLIVG